MMLEINCHHAHLSIRQIPIPRGSAGGAGSVGPSAAPLPTRAGPGAVVPARRPGPVTEIPRDDLHARTLETPTPGRNRPGPARTVSD
ncbi:hypothetical protein GCM10010343_11120 [Streptomyces avidinii]|nr:hypothetical protein GCM10010343_11120 [Streptomyces avidinii]